MSASAWSDLDGWVYLSVDTADGSHVKVRMSRDTARKAAIVLGLATDKAEEYAPYLDAFTVLHEVVERALAARPPIGFVSESEGSKVRRMREALIEIRGVVG